ncbi:50S ribosomal protein L21 isoform 2 [Theobroma cacao]|uniref:50S ribosomal protein L21 isoform 2 n=1 Tax=Theobroma cacao TaxID=3641 RepID=A0A061FKN6_THECC|nr:50S ribosomal protein L21 isoform 2 [Theobroma cacao]
MASSSAHATLALCSSFATHCKISNHPHHQNSLLFSPSKTPFFSLSNPFSFRLTPSPLLSKTPTFCTIPKSSESDAGVVETEPDNIQSEPEPAPEPAEVVEAAKDKPKREEIFAVVMIGSRQYIVFPGRYIYTQRLKGANVNDEIVLNKVLLVGTKTTTYIGKPVVTNAAVHAVVEEQAGIKSKSSCLQVQEEEKLSEKYWTSTAEYADKDNRHHRLPRLSSGDTQLLKFHVEDWKLQSLLFSLFPILYVFHFQVGI